MANYSGRSLFWQLFLVFCCCVFSLEASKNDDYFEELYIKPLQSGHVSFYFQFTTKWNVSVQEADNCKMISQTECLPIPFYIISLSLFIIM